MGVIHDKPATHPTPWKWNGEDGGIVATTALLDATGAEVVYVLDAGDWGVSIQICNPNVRALLAAARLCLPIAPCPPFRRGAYQFPRSG